MHIHVQTTPSYRSSSYGRRRGAIRDTFLPDFATLPDSEFKFVIGQTGDPLVTASMAYEELLHPGTFMHLNMTVRVSLLLSREAFFSPVDTQAHLNDVNSNKLAPTAPHCSLHKVGVGISWLWWFWFATAGCVQECYRCLPQKTQAFFLSVALNYNAKWIVKMDDDVYLMPPRLLAAASQWSDIGAQYVGCMKQGDVHTANNDKWFEPAWKLLAERYHLNAYGSIYALSGDVVSRVLQQNGNKLRQLANEGMTRYHSLLVSHYQIDEA